MMRNIQTREGYEFWDKICAVQSYAFLLSPDGRCVVKTPDIGDWIDKHEAQVIVDHAQEEFNVMKAERDALLVREAELTQELERQKRYVEINANSAQGKHAEGQRYRDERDALQQRLNAADQRIDELERGEKAPLDPPQPITEQFIEDHLGKRPQ